MNTPNNPLNRYPKVRQVLYDIQWMVSGVVVVIGGWLVATETSAPGWYVGVAGTLPVLWGYLGFTAARNVDTFAEYDPRDEHPDLGEAVDDVG